MDLSRRLLAVANFVSDGRSVADIGCDHGYVSIYLIKERHCQKVIAMDVNEGPLLHAKANIKKYGFEDKIETRLSDGTKALNQGEVDTLLMAGMGGRLMKRILAEGFENLGRFEELILQPQSEVAELRGYLRETGYAIVDEDFIIEEGKFYPIIKAQIADCSTKNNASAKNEQEELEDLFGPVLLKKRPEDFLSYLEIQKEKTETVLLKVTQDERKEELKYYLMQLEKAIQMA